MVAQRFGRVQKATALLPLALLSAAWTASLAGAGSPSAASYQTATGADASKLPDGQSLPTKAIEAPASVGNGINGLQGLGGQNAQQVAASSNAAGIPAAALSAYQRAETVINRADSSCKLPWQLVAAIGRVESNHGRANGNVLSSKGISEPGIYGIALNGKNGTQAVPDTDAGQYDRDTKWDRAVGPMQFIPSTWSVVGVDADGDGKRDPQDINDAALATAVYLCSGNDDLSTTQGQEASVFRYNHSKSYVDLVLSIMDAYMSGDYTSVPNSTSTVTAAGPISRVPGYVPPSSRGQQGGAGQGRAQGPSGSQGSQQGSGTTGGGSSQPTQQPTPSSPAPTTPSGGSDPATTVKKTVKKVTKPVKKVVKNTTGTVGTVLSKADAIVKCTAKGLVDNPLDNNDAFDQCVADLTGS